MPLTIIEIIKPAEQGLSTPFLCRGDDDLLYFVKGRNSGRASQWAEWLAGHVGRAFGLPIPPFRLVDVPANLVRECPPELRPIGSGIAFASLRREAAQWLEPAAIGRVPASLRRDVLMFDWWIRNQDRTRGNPNLLWAPDTEELVVIDHNQAFDPLFQASKFLKGHLFSADAEAVFSDLVEQARYSERMERALEVWDSACDNAPPEWRWANDEQDVPANFDPEAARALVARCSTPDFWR